MGDALVPRNGAASGSDQRADRRVRHFRWHSLATIRHSVVFRCARTRLSTDTALQTRVYVPQNKDRKNVVGNAGRGSTRRGSAPRRILSACRRRATRALPLSPCRFGTCRADRALHPRKLPTMARPGATAPETTSGRPHKVRIGAAARGWPLRYCPLVEAFAVASFRNTSGATTNASGTVFAVPV